MPFDPKVEAKIKEPIEAILSLIDNKVQRIYEISLDI
jgi:hypothetical protein